MLRSRFAPGSPWPANGHQGRWQTLSAQPDKPRALSLTEDPAGLAPGAILCALDDIEDGASRVFTFGDEDGRRLEIFVHRLGGAALAYVNRCPHAGHPLDWTPGRFMDPSGRQFQCASHGARFRIEDGFCVSGPCPGRYLTPVLIRVEDGLIRVA